MFVKDSRNKDILYNASSCRGFKLDENQIEIWYESGVTSIKHETQDEAKGSFKLLQEGIRRGDNLIII